MRAREREQVSVRHLMVSQNPLAGADMPAGIAIAQQRVRAG